MNKTKLNCSLNDTTELRNLITENPDLPLLIFCGDEAWGGIYAYEKADVNNVEIKEVTLYKRYWIEEDEYKEKLSDDLCDKEEYSDLSDREFGRVIEKMVAETEFVKAIVIYVG